MKPLHLAATLVTALVVITGVNSALRPPRPDRPLKPKPKPVKTSEARCTIKRAVFGGTEAAVLQIMKGRTVHYVVLDLPTNNLRMPDYQSRWIEANYGTAQTTLVGVYPSVEDALVKAGSLCKSN